MECLLDNWNWSLGHRWDANFGVPLAFGSLVRGVCWCSAVPSFRSVSLSSRSVVPRLCFRDSPQVVYILYLVHGKFFNSVFKCPWHIRYNDINIFSIVLRQKISNKSPLV